LLTAKEHCTGNAQNIQISCWWQCHGNNIEFWAVVLDSNVWKLRLMNVTIQVIPRQVVTCRKLVKSSIKTHEVPFWCRWQVTYLIWNMSVRPKACLVTCSYPLHSLCLGSSLTNTDSKNCWPLQMWPWPCRVLTFLFWFFVISYCFWE
jgi:hypothetical protein